MKLEKTDKIISLAKNGAMLRKFVNERLPKVRQDKYGIIDRREGDVARHGDLGSHYHSDCAISRSPAHLGAARLIRTLLILTKV